ncbi:MAG: primosomal protein N' [Defluviitaleaceae bacterium]|nr:primosomal protein N' [Defluviitaleaceae bacterium]
MTSYALVSLSITNSEVDRLFHYAIPQGLGVQPGYRVKVPFGKGSKLNIGYVIELTEDPGDVPPGKIKPIDSVLDDFPVLTGETLKLALWMKDKYYTTLAHTIRAITPTAKADGRFPSTRRKKVATEPKPNNVQLTAAQTGALELILAAAGVGFDAGPVGGKLAPTESKNFSADVISRPVDVGCGDDEHCKVIWNGGIVSEEADSPDCILQPMGVGAAGCDDANVSECSIQSVTGHETHTNTLSTGKRRRPPQGVVVFGVTGSGKTEVYLHAIERVLEAGRQAVVLVPEIALTPQMVRVFTARFGSLVAVTHSRLTAGERFQIWKQCFDGEVSLVIGPRSAVFAPFKNLGLIVVDEEHEHTYHSETTPKYDAREVALKRAQLSGGAVVLGSATPSLESFYRAQTGEYALARLPERVNKTNPDVTVLDMRYQVMQGNVSLFAMDLRKVMEATLAAGKQVILFLNRRGHSSFVSCRWCGYVLACDSCRVNYTYHADKDALLCHYCGDRAAMPKACPTCNHEHIRRMGMGTQKLEEEVLGLFPAVKVLRMDTDTTRGKEGHAKILEAFGRGEAQVLIGTQMVAKGLDFPDVTLVGVVAADMSLFTGDFRAAEHSFQLLTQVSGRAGRAAHKGDVFLQTYNPGHYAIQFAKTGDYESFYSHEIELRRSMVYPPFSHVFAVMITGEREREVITALQKLQAIMEYCIKKDGKGRFEIIGMSPALVSKVKNNFRWKILIKCTMDEPLKAFVLYCIKKLKENDPLTGLTLHLTLNPIIME